MVAVRWRSVELDCADPVALADFWARLLHGEVVRRTPELCRVRADNGMHLTAARVDDYRSPDWPDGPRPKQIHLDLSVDDLDAAEQAARALGAQRAATQPQPDRWRVLFDPAGHPFCLSTQIPD